MIELTKEERKYLRNLLDIEIDALEFELAFDDINVDYYSK